MPGSFPLVAARLDDASPLVRGAAVWALATLDPDAARRHGEQRPPDTDPNVKEEWDDLGP